MSTFGPGDYPTGIEIDEAIREARRERGKIAEELLGLAAGAVRSAVIPAPEHKLQPALAAAGTDGRKGAL